MGRAEWKRRHPLPRTANFKTCYWRARAAPTGIRLKGPQTEIPQVDRSSPDGGNGGVPLGNCSSLHPPNRCRFAVIYCSSFPYREHPEISFDSEETTLRKLREQLQAMSDEELIKFGKYARSLAGLRISETGDPYKVKLDEAIAEWRA